MSDQTPFSDAFELALSRVTERADEDGWDLFVSPPNFAVYRRTRADHPALYEYKAVGGYPDVSPALLATVYTDLDFRKSWDSNMLGWRALPDSSLYYIVKYPYPMSNRDYVYRQERRDIGDAIVILGEGVLNRASRDIKGTVRIIDFAQEISILPDGPGGCRICMTYFEDPRGSIPSFVVNWAAKTGLPQFIKNLHDACIKYRSDH